MAEPINILVTGGSGQVGRELAAFAWPAGVTVHTPASADLDITDATSVRAAFAARPYAAVINAAAYTAVDRAEQDFGRAWAVNALGPALLAEATRAAGIPLVHVSTDYVFDGEAGRPYEEDDRVSPLGAYGASKLSGEIAVRAGNPKSVVMRTAWVLSPHGSNFLKTMLRLAGERSEIRVVSDQRGCPTSATDLAACLAQVALAMASDPGAPTGIYQFVNAGEATWAELAREVMAASARRGGVSASIVDISTAEYPTPARRPGDSRLVVAKVMRDYGIRPRPWAEAVGDIVDRIDLKGVS